MNRSSSFVPRWLVLITGTFIAFLVLFMFLNQNGMAQSLSSHSVEIKNGFNKQTIKYKNNSGFQNFEIEYQGTIEVTDDDKDIKSISPGGFIEISKTTFGTRRDLYIEADGSGKLKKEYSEGRKEMPFNPAGKKWLSEILPEIVLTTRIAAESRVNRFYRNGGVNSVIKGISDLKSDYVQVYYAELLLEKEGLGSSDLINIIQSISQQVDSDYYLAGLLKDKSDIFFKDDKTTEAYFQGLTNINSDYYLSVALKHAVQKSNPSAASMQKLLMAIESIDSDYYQTVVVSELLENENLSGDVLNALVNASRNIGSDYYQSTVLKKALEHKNLSPDAFNTLLLEISNVSSDYYMASIFGDLLERDLKPEMKMHIVKTVSSEMSSDYYLATLLSKVLKDGDTSIELSEAILDAVSKMNSDYYASTVISGATKNSSAYNKRSLLALIKATEYINSDFYQMEALTDLAYVINRLNDAEVKDAYRIAAKNIASDTYYGRALKALD